MNSSRMSIYSLPNQIQGYANRRMKRFETSFRQLPWIVYIQVAPDFQAAMYGNKRIHSTPYSFIILITQLMHYGKKTRLGFFLFPHSASKKLKVIPPNPDSSVVR